MDLCPGASRRNKILILEKRALIVSFVHSHAHAIPIFIDANVLPLTFLYYMHESVSNLMHDVNNNNTP